MTDPVRPRHPRADTFRAERQAETLAMAAVRATLATEYGEGPHAHVRFWLKRTMEIGRGEVRLQIDRLRRRRADGAGHSTNAKRAAAYAEALCDLRTHLIMLDDFRRAARALRGD